MTRLYFPKGLRANSRCTLPTAQAHHVLNVMRLAAGAAVTVFDGLGYEYSAVIAQIGRDAVLLDVGDAIQVDRESPLSVTLVQGISSGDRMDYTVQKAVELGVAAIQPLATARSVVKLDADRSRKRVDRWQTIAASACEQSGRNVVPEIRPVQSLADWLAIPSPPGQSRLMLQPGVRTRLRDLARPAGRLALLVGPEGGFDEREQREAIAGGCSGICLGPRVLRTETAGVAALAAIQALWGDF